MRALGPLGVALAAAAALPLLAPVLVHAQDRVEGPLAPAVERGGGAPAEPPAAAQAHSPDAGSADPPAAVPEAPEAFAADEPLDLPRGRRRWSASFGAGYTRMFVRPSFAAERHLGAPRASGLVLAAGLSLWELASLRLAFGAAGQVDASPRVQLTDRNLAEMVLIQFAKLALGLRTPLLTFRAHGLGAVLGASGGYTFTRVTRSTYGCTSDCPPVTTVPLGGGAFVEPELMLGYGEDRGVHVGLGVAYARYLFASRLVDTVEVKLGGGF